MYQVQLLFLHKSSTLYDNIDYYDDYREAYFADDDIPKRTCFKNNLNGSLPCLLGVLFQFMYCVKFLEIVPF